MAAITPEFWYCRTRIAETIQITKYHWQQVNTSILASTIIMGTIIFYTEQWPWGFGEMLNFSTFRKYSFGPLSIKARGNTHAP
jgi:hypothetical protein